MKGNATYKALEERILAFRQRTGRDYAGVWITTGDWLLLPEAVRGEALAGALRGGPRYIRIQGVPVRHHEVLDPLPAD